MTIKKQAHKTTLNEKNVNAVLIKKTLLYPGLGSKQ